MSDEKRQVIDKAAIFDRLQEPVPKRSVQEVGTFPAVNLKDLQPTQTPATPAQAPISRGDEQRVVLEREAVERAASQPRSVRPPYERPYEPHHQIETIKQVNELQRLAVRLAGADPSKDVRAMTPGESFKGTPVSQIEQKALVLESADSKALRVVPYEAALAKVRVPVEVSLDAQGKTQFEKAAIAPEVSALGKHHEQMAELLSRGRNKPVELMQPGEVVTGKPIGHTNADPARGATNHLIIESPERLVFVPSTPEIKRSLTELRESQVSLKLEEGQKQASVVQIRDPKGQWQAVEPMSAPARSPEMAAPQRPEPSLQQEVDTRLRAARTGTLDHEFNREPIPKPIVLNDKQPLEPLPERFELRAIKAQLEGIQNEPSARGRAERFGHLVQELAKPAYEAQAERWAGYTDRALSRLMPDNERQAPDAMIDKMAKGEQLPASAALSRQVDLSQHLAQDPQSLKNIAAHEGLASIKVLSVAEQPRFDDKALQAVIDNPHAKGLQRLELEGTAVTQAGVKALASAPQMAGLERVSLGSGINHDSPLDVTKSREYLQASPHLTHTVQHAPPLSVERFAQVREELTGERFGAPKPNLTHEGIVKPEVVKLKEGDFMAIDKGQGKLQLVPASSELTAHAGQNVKLSREGQIEPRPPEREAPQHVR